MKVYIGTPKGEMILVNLNWKKNIIRSLTRGGISKLRECGWDILKKGNDGCIWMIIENNNQKSWERIYDLTKTIINAD